MIKATLLGSAVLISLAGCARIADSRFNPFNWFATSQEAPVTATGEIRPLIPQNRQTITVDDRVAVQSITTLVIDRTPGGALIRATGIAPSIGYFNAELVNLGTQNGVLTLEFRAQAPTGPQPETTASSRQITAALAINDRDLAGVSTIRVQSATNARTSRR